ncbi:MAG TPA: hypothetical protein PLE14_06915, partial [Anaerolineales bacterium]|nr:hypothetical protein [Anaerolineales bacterium]
PPVYHHFILLIWEERDGEGERVAWRFSLHDSQKEVRVGFKNFEDLIFYLKKWMEQQPSSNFTKGELK